MVIHSTGTTVPNAPLVPERLKAQVYILPRFLQDHPEAYATITFLVQTYIEHVGIPTAREWRNRAMKIWSLTQCGHLALPVLPTTLIPIPPAYSVHYIFKGRPWGDLRLDVPLLTPAQNIAPAAARADDDDDLYIDDITFDNDAIALMDAVERVERLEAENHS
jgi:hypothetical protein